MKIWFTSDKNKLQLMIKLINIVPSSGYVMINGNILT